MKVLFFGTYDKHSHPRIQSLIEGLRAHGDEVTEVNLPWGLSTAERVQGLKNARLVPRMAVGLLRKWVALYAAGRRANRDVQPDAVVVGYLGHFDVHLARAVFRNRPLVLDHLIFAGDTARDRGTDSRWKLATLDLLDKVALRAADIVLVDTSEHLSLIPESLRSRGVVVAVGAPDEWFASRAPLDARRGPLRLVFFGHFTPLQGTVTIGEALAMLRQEPTIETLIIGAGQDFEAARLAAGRSDAVTWVPWVDPAELPGVVAASDACLGIFGTTEKARRVVPNKVYQGAAVGCAVVTSDTPAQRRALGDAAVFVPTGDASALADVLAALARDPERVRALRLAAVRVADAQFTPAAIVKPLRARLATLLPGRRST